MTDVTSQFEQAAAHLLSESAPELTPAVLAAARAVLAVPESRLSEAALQMLVQIVVFLDAVAETTDRAAGEASAGDLEQLLRRTDIDDMSRARLLYLRSERLTSLGQARRRRGGRRGVRRPFPRSVRAGSGSAPDVRQRPGQTRRHSWFVRPA